MTKLGKKVLRVTLYFEGSEPDVITNKQATDLVRRKLLMANVWPVSAQAAYDTFVTKVTATVTATVTDDDKP